MRDLVRATIKATAASAGLDPEKIYELAASDNLTIERPYMTIQFLPETYKRTGRKLALTRKEMTECRKRELYEVELAVAANILAEDEAWLSDFAFSFVAALPGGLNDRRGNWVKVRAQKAQFSKPPDRRIANDVIEVFVKRDQLFELTFTGRVTAEEYEAIIPGVTLNPYWAGYSSGMGD